ncbi:unnamed protein product [Ranitomeya imitator]|uniref:Reverse transcriptase domain-containing protein n=1 Tax=Ranitomeya imitator TaxID=111125 RepID=A0ABN9MN84_9NEOB|nr:unnamed protein product [Ranitomeya imitator]
MLPKIHKSGNPGKTIISCVGTLPEQVCGWVEGILKPLVKDTRSYIQDTTDLLNKLAAIGPLPEGTILATMDMESLYSNIPHQDGLNAFKVFMENTGTDANSVVKLAKFILTHNCFEFDNKIYLQETGTAMGSKMAPQYANVFMAKLESEFLSSCTIRPLAYYHYIDDNLIIWTESEPQLKTIHEQFNQFHPTINLTLNYSCTEINCLNTIIKLQNNEIETSLYQKPIDRPTYLKWDSFHPKYIKSSIVYNQAIRYNLICSNPMDRNKHLGHLRKTFLNQGYHPRTIQNQITRATRISRNHLLHYKAKEENNWVPLVVIYNANLEALRGAAWKLQPLLQKDYIPYFQTSSIAF